jgi:hypothetical protein
MSATVIFAVAVLLPQTLVRVIVATPGEIAVTMPVLAMSRMLSFELLHITSRSEAFDGVNIGINLV